MIEAENVRKRLGTTEVLRGIDLVVAPGEVVALMGENGAGKSTLLRIISGTVTPDGGVVRVGGRDVQRERREASRLTGRVLGGDHAWQLRLGGQANLEFFARLAGIGAAEAAAAAADALEGVGLADVADRPVGAYSSGMRARLALARARVRPCAALLLDEPADALDAHWRQEMWDWVRRPDKREAVLIATHDAEEAAAVSDRVIVLEAGRLG